MYLRLISWLHTASSPSLPPQVHRHCKEQQANRNTDTGKSIFRSACLCRTVWMYGTVCLYGTVCMYGSVCMHGAVWMYGTGHFSSCHLSRGSARVCAICRCRCCALNCERMGCLWSEIFSRHITEWYSQSESPGSPLNKTRPLSMGVLPLPYQ